MGEVTLTDRTFGDLTVTLERLESMPRARNLREVQWRLSVVGKEGTKKT
jgi:hypothetical protein